MLCRQLHIEPSRDVFGVRFPRGLKERYQRATRPRERRNHLVYSAFEIGASKAVTVAVRKERILRKVVGSSELRERDAFKKSAFAKTLPLAPTL
jgi:hypothetical protein